MTLTEAGMEKLEQRLRAAGQLKGDSLYDVENVSVVHHVNQALRAHKLFQRDKDYIVRNGEVVIIDEFTGRMMPGRRYSEGLHQALEAKEHQPIQPENQTLASITFQNYFRMYEKLAGMTGTALTEADEFMDIYNLEVLEVPTNMPLVRIDDDDEVYRTAAEKYRAIITLIEDCKKRGQPVLVGTTSIEKSEQLAEMLRQAGWEQHDFSDPNAFAALYSGDDGATKTKVFAILNARYHEQEAYIVSQAGVPGAITIATNMAGRGTDIQLGGNADMRIRQEIADIADPREREKSPRADEIREQVARLKEKALAAGGLYVLGTERHESRRIDNQLRGRSGRQGDPGHSKFFLSLEDDLMRIFGSDKLDGMLQKLGLKENEAIVHPWINKALEKAQQKVEARNFDIRKNLLKFDNVMNDQRKVIFEQRLELMRDETVDETIADMRHAMIEDLVAKHIPENAYAEQWDVAGLDDDAARSAHARAAGPGMGQGRRHCRRGSARAHHAARRRVDGGQGGQMGPRRHALCREVDPAADARSSLARAPRHARAPAPGDRLARLRPARSAQRIQGGGLRAVRGDGGAFARGGHRAAHARRSRAAAAAEEAQQLPYMEAHKVDPTTGEDEMAPAAGAGARRQRQWRAGGAQSERPVELGQGRPQRAVPLRLRQEVQALPRQIRLSAVQPPYCVIAQPPAECAVALEVPLAAHGVTLARATFRIEQHPYAAARRARAFAGIVLCQSPRRRRRSSRHKSDGDCS